MQNYNRNENNLYEEEIIIPNYSEDQIEIEDESKTVFRDEYTNEIRNEIEPLYVMTVELQEGNSQTIKIYPDSTPQELAFEFCKRNNLDLPAMNYLSEQIRNLLDELNQTYKTNNSQECIQEVDEDEFQTEKTRKSNTGTNNQSQEITMSNKNFKQVYPKSLTKNNNNNTNNDLINTISESKKKLQFDYYDNEENIIVKDKIKSNKKLNENESHIKKFTSNDNNYEILNTNNLMEEDEEIKSNKLMESKNGFIENLSNNISNNVSNNVSNNNELFSYQMLHPEESQRKRSSLHSKIEKSPINPIKESIFERLFKNADQKRWGAFGSRSRFNRGESTLSVKSNKSLRSKSANKMPLNQNGNMAISNASMKSINSRFNFKNGETINYGERLYQKGIKLKEETLKRLDEFRKWQEIDDRDIYTFKPRTNEIPEEVLKRRQDNALNYDRNILRYNNFMEEKLAKLREKHQKSEDYSFTPTIDKNSAHMANNKMINKLKMQMTQSVSPNPHKMRIEDLYDCAKLKENRINQLADKVNSTYNYTPVINNYQDTNSEMLNLKFDQRQEIYRQKSQEKMNKIKEDYLSPIDKSTGQSLFNPKISNKSKERINMTNQTNTSQNFKHTSNIFNNLYSYAQKYNKNKIERENNFNDTVKKFSQSVHTANDSEAILNKRKEDVFRKLFKLIDSDQDDSISSINLDVRRLPQNILKILNPIINELKEENETLNENEFISACQHLYEVK